jgi:integrase
MATFEKRSGAWRARVRKSGVDRTETFRTKAEAQAWATQLEAELASERRGEIPEHKTFGDLLERYAAEVAPSKRGGDKELLRIAATRQRDIAKVKLRDLDERHVSKWRDDRLKEVLSSSVLREWTTLSHVCTTAVRDWRWLKTNPFLVARRPAGQPARKRRPEGNELDRILHALGYSEESPPLTKTARVGAAALFAIETAMRESEIARLRWCDITGRVARVVQSKTDDEAHQGRDVPLSSEALRILSRLPRRDGDEAAACFDVPAKSIDALWRKGKAMALVDGLTFHDLRREATTRLAKKLDVLTLAKVTGHRDLRVLSRVYYAPDMGEVAERLD